MFRFLCKKGVTSYQMNPKSVIVKKVTYSVRLPLCGDDDKYFHNVKVMMVNSTTVIIGSKLYYSPQKKQPYSDTSDSNEDTCDLAFNSDNACDGESKGKVEALQAFSTSEKSEIVAYRIYRIELRSKTHYHPITFSSGWLGVMPPLRPVSVAQKNKPSTMLSSNVQSMDCTAWRLWTMRQPNGCSTPAPKSSAAKQWIKELLQNKKL